MGFSEWMKGQEQSFEKAVESLSKQWLGKEGVCGVGDEIRDGQPVIVVLVNDGQSIPHGIPRVHGGYRVVLDKSGTIIAQEMVGTGAVYDGSKPKNGEDWNWWGAPGSKGSTPAKGILPKKKQKKS